jgi:hypothetical protein
VLAGADREGQRIEDARLSEDDTRVLQIEDVQRVVVAAGGGVARDPSSRSMSRIAAGSPLTRRNFETISRAVFLFLDLLGQEPLQLGHLGEGFLGEAQLVEPVDLRGDALLVRQRLLEHRRQRLEGHRRLRERLELDCPISRQHEVEQLHGVLPFFFALHAQPFRARRET